VDGVSETLGLATFTWRGQTWKLPRPNFFAEDMIRAYLQHRERHWVQVQADFTHPDFPKSRMSSAEYLRHLEGWRENCVKGKWAFKKPDWFTAMNDPECFAEMIFLSLTQLGEQGGVTRADVREMIKDKQAECDRRRAQAQESGLDSDEVIATIRSEIVEAFDGLLASTPSIPPQAAGESR
jgi:hypothetical protein